VFTILCDKCKSKLIIDEMSTIDSYLADADFSVDESGKIKDEVLVQYLIYRCPKCNETYKFTYKEWELRYRRSLAQDAMEYRKQKMFREEINPHAIDPDNGLEFCGQCSGYAGDGNCLVDIIKQCTIRKK